jgi:hypothetical protein
MDDNEKFTEKITFRVKKSTKAELETKYKNPSEVMRKLTESLVSDKHGVACNV